MNLNKIEHIRNKLKNKEVSVGCWQQIPHSSISEILGCSGYDWVAIDLEHGSISINQLPDLIRAIELGDSAPLVRISQPTAHNCKRALDAGASGIIAPMIENYNQCKLVRESVSLPPVGSRGVGFSRANLFGKNFEKYNQEAQFPLFIIQIESILAVKNLEEILQVKGIDAVMVGPYDLSASMNITGLFENKKYHLALEQIKKTCLSFNVPFGYHITEANKGITKKIISQGYQFIAYCTDGIILTEHYKNFN